MPALCRLAALHRSLSPDPSGSPPHPTLGGGGSAVAPAGASAAGERGWDLSDEELYLLDTMGFLRVRNVLDKPTISEALDAAMRGSTSGAFDSCLRRGRGENPGGDFYDNAMLHDKVLERVSCAAIPSAALVPTPPPPPPPRKTS
eukprot:COSAG04_NODE_6716_length_1271_cov_141.409556_2_plen_144_part_01